MWRTYYHLTKPRMVYGNAMTTLAAFLFASRWSFAPLLLLATLLGIGLVIAGSCVFNNYIDRDIDRKMTRTKNRALVTGAVSGEAAFIFGGALLVCGLALLYSEVNALTALVAFGGFVVYVFLYAWAKRASHWGTLVGSIAGAVPITVGYTAVSDRLDLTALLLFVILALWQMPHFYAIATYRLQEYAAANIPVLPRQKGMRATKLHIIWYIVAYIVAACALALFGVAGYVYLGIVLLSGLAWLALALKGFKASDEAAWARLVFKCSLLVLVSFSLALALAPLLP